MMLSALLTRVFCMGEERKQQGACPLVVLYDEAHKFFCALRRCQGLSAEVRWSEQRPQRDHERDKLVPRLTKSTGARLPQAGADELALHLCNRQARHLCDPCIGESAAPAGCLDAGDRMPDVRRQLIDVLGNLIFPRRRSFCLRPSCAELALTEPGDQ
jgi:hypothetical protein